MRKRYVYLGTIALIVLIVTTFFTASIISYAIPSHWRDRLTREEALYDFDYMIAALEANFPSFGIIYRQHEVDMLEVANDLRDRLEHGSSRVRFDVFWDMLRDEFFYHASPVGCPLAIGHLRLVSDNERQWLFSQYDKSRGWGASSYLARILSSEPTHPSYPYLRANTYPIEPSPGWYPNRRISTRIIEEGVIGYLRVYTLSRFPDYIEWGRLTEFYSEIADFEHLIIDIRGNTGGGPQMFEQAVTSYLIARPISARFHHFLKDGEHNMRFLQSVRGFERLVFGDMSNVAFEDGGGHHLFGGRAPDYIIDEIEKMSYRFIDSHVIRPWDPRRRSQFDGIIWLLIDGNVYSGAMHVAAFHKDAGFATLVGETTGGGAI